MAKVIKNADVHEKTVQTAELQARIYGTKRKSAKSRTAKFHEKYERVPGTRGHYRRRGSSVQQYHWFDGLDPDLLKYVRDNNVYWARVEIISPTEIIIHNRVGWKVK